MNKLFAIGGCLVLALIIGLTLTWPKYQSLSVLGSNVEVKEEELQSKEEYFNKIKEISVVLGEYTDALGKISSALPETPSLPSLFNFLQSSASQTGLITEKIELISLDKGEIRVNCQVIGEYPAFKDFLKVLEKSARIIEVEKVDFEVPEEIGEPIKFTVEVKTQSY